MSQGHIYIHGTIGSFSDPSGVEVKGVELLDVIAQVKAQPTASGFLVHIGSPGGLVDAGDQIYNYLESLKVNGLNIDTISDTYTDSKTGELKSGVGSIATKIFLAGSNRSIIEGHEFFIHNPWTQPQPGDSVKIKVELKALEQKESELRAFYQQHTKVTETGLKGLMDNETGMPADMALLLGFATRKVATQKVKAFAQLSNNQSKNMATETIGQKIDAIFSFLKTKEKALTEPAAALPGADPNTPPTDPNTLPDGEYPLADGRILVVAGGQIKEVKMPAAAAAPNALPPAAAVPPVAATPSLAEKELQAKIAAQETELATLKAEQAKASAALDDVKNALVVGKSPAKAFNNNGNNGAPNTYTHKSISDIMAEKKEERKKELNKN